MRTPDPTWLRNYHRAPTPNHAIRAGLKAYFGIDTAAAKRFIDPTLMPHRILLDVCALDDWLTTQGTGNTG